jgi:hypothetical protein
MRGLGHKTRSEAIALIAGINAIAWDFLVCGFYGGRCEGAMPIFRSFSEAPAQKLRESSYGQSKQTASI